MASTQSLVKGTICFSKLLLNQQWTSLPCLLTTGWSIAPQIQCRDILQCALHLLYTLGSSLLPIDLIVQVAEGLNESFTKTVDLQSRHRRYDLKFSLSSNVHIEFLAKHMLVFHALVYD